MAKSIEKQKMIIPGTYEGLWSAYYVQIRFKNGNFSDEFKVDGGVRGINCKCTCIVDENGDVYVH